MTAHRWQKGQSGNPRGAPRRGTATVTEMMRLLVTENAKELASKLVAMALAGDLKAAELVLNRVEGPVRQAIDVTLLRSRAERLAAQYGLDPTEVAAEAERILRSQS